jgi:hypothetical protein
VALPGSEWISHFLVGDVHEELKKRWISIPRNVWHQGFVGDMNWTVLSFHTCGAFELIEEWFEGGDIHTHFYIGRRPK